MLPNTQISSVPLADTGNCSNSEKMSVESENLLIDVIDSMEQGIIVWDAKGICELHNERVFGMLELSSADLYVGLSRVEFLQLAVTRGEFVQKVADQAAAQFQIGDPFSFERVMPSGRRIVSSARPRQCGGFVVTFSDISLLKEKEEELELAKTRAESAESELGNQLQNLTVEKAILEKQKIDLVRLSMVATHAKDIIAITTACGDIEWINEGFTHTLGFELNDVSGEMLTDVLFDSKNHASDIQAVVESIKGRHVVRRELICRKKSLKSFWMEVEITPVFSDEGKHTHFIAVGRDTTKRKNADDDAQVARNFEHRKRNEANLLAEFNGWLQSTDSLGELFPVVSAFLRKLLPSSSGAVYVYANSRDVLEQVCNWNDGKVINNFEPPDCWALRRGRSYYYGENEVDFACHHVLESHGDAIPARYYCLPIIAHGDTVGLLCVELPASSDDDDNQETQKLANFCGEQISLAIANVQLREQLLDQSTRDPLTTLYNRRYFIEAARRELQRCEKGGVASLISFDVDYFKKFNDNYGHDAGDSVLREMSKVLQKEFRDSDIPCRYGGEEFAIFLPGANAEVAMRRAEQLRQTVAATVVRYSGEELKITISCGVASYPEDGASIQPLIKNADKALYAAKEDGRDNVKHFNELS